MRYEGNEYDRNQNCGLNTPTSPTKKYTTVGLKCHHDCAYSSAATNCNVYIASKECSSQCEMCATEMVALWECMYDTVGCNSGNDVGGNDVTKIAAATAGSIVIVAVLILVLRKYRRKRLPDNQKVSQAEPPDTTNV